MILGHYEVPSPLVGFHGSLQSQSQFHYRIADIIMPLSCDHSNLLIPSNSFAVCESSKQMLCVIRGQI